MRFDTPDPKNPGLPAQSTHTGTRARMVPFIAILFLAAVFASGCVIHDRGHGRGHYSGPVVVQPHVDVAPPAAVITPAPVVFSFTDHHRHSVRNYYHEHPRHHKNKHKWKSHPGKGRGRGHMPPGLRKRSVLPPGIRMQSPPAAVVRQLPHPPRGTRYVYHEDQVLLINLNTRVVVDFINISVGY